MRRQDPRRFMDPALRRDVRFLTSLLGEIIREQEGAALFRTIEKIRTLAKASRARGGGQIRRLSRLIARLPYKTALKVARAFTIYFQLVNLAEEAQRIRRILWYESQSGQSLDMSLTWTAHRLKSAGVSSRAFLKRLEGAEVTPVLTAHPTEVRRRTTMDHLADIGRALEAWSDPLATPAQKGRSERSIRETLEILWATNEARQRKLAVADEVSQTLFFVERTILDLIPEMYDRLEGLARALGPGAPARVPSVLHFGSWVGADRDGNPNVTPQVTWETAAAHRRVILEYYRRKLEDLIRRFSQAETLLPAGRALHASLEKDRGELPGETKQLARYEASEAYRKKLSFMHSRILRAQSGQPGGYQKAEELMADLRLIQESLKSQGSRYAASELEELIRQVETFRFYLAHLEYRDHRDRILKALSEILPAVLKRNIPYEALSEEERQGVLTGLLAGSRVPPLPLKGFSAAAQEILAQFKTMEKIQRELDPELARTYLLSMTRAPSDILAVLLFGLWAGVSFDVVPLFETVPDLARSQEVMVNLWTNRAYRRYLAARGFRQEV
ncbi:MAG: phosphoenolpyruvate carboxylase, partial [Candidatus Omnitrophica bacterium]|nr:phosphoenolpyruvate carboxylase [Candidatus Omnitrophota bacterium]